MAGETVGRTDGEDRQVGEPGCFDVVPVPSAVADADLGLAGAQIRDRVVGVDGELDIGMQRIEPPQPRHQPARGDGRLDRNGKPARAGGGKDVAGRGLQSVEEVRDFARVPRPGLAQHHPPSGAMEELQAKPLLEVADVPAHRGMGDEKLVRRGRKALMPGGGFEGAQCVERWQAAGHAASYV